MNQRSATTEHRKAVPFWRDERVLKVLVQIVFVMLVIAVGLWGISNYMERGLTFTFSFLDEEASFDLAEGIEFAPTDTYARAFLVGVLNTLRVAAIGIILASIVGLIAGIARLSNNWLVSKIAGVYIEIIRNTPLLVQLFFLYFAVILNLPSIKEVIVLPGPVYLSNRGIVFPWPRLTASFGGWWWFVVAALIGAVVLLIIRKRGLKRTGHPSFSLLYVCVPLIAIPVLGWMLISGSPLLLDLPEMVVKSGGVLKVEGGTG